MKTRRWANFWLKSEEKNGGKENILRSVRREVNGHFVLTSRPWRVRPRAGYWCSSNNEVLIEEQFNAMKLTFSMEKIEWRGWGEKWSDKIFYTWISLWVLLAYNWVFFFSVVYAFINYLLFDFSSLEYKIYNQNISVEASTFDHFIYIYISIVILYTTIANPHERFSSNLQVP